MGNPEVFGKFERDWLTAKSIRNIMPTIPEVLTLCEAFKNDTGILGLPLKGGEGDPTMSQIYEEQESTKVQGFPFKCAIWESLFSDSQKHPMARGIG